MKIAKNFEKRKKYYLCGGEMAEWSNAAVLKTVVPQGTGGSNPSFSAKATKDKNLHKSVGFLFSEAQTRREFTHVRVCASGNKHYFSVLL